MKIISTVLLLIFFTGCCIPDYSYMTRECQVEYDYQKNAIGGRMSEVAFKNYQKACFESRRKDFLR